METVRRWSTLFTPEPGRWGLRGDPYLWRELASELENVALPATPAAFDALLAATFQRLVGVDARAEAPVFVARYSHGGMSSGRVDPAFWRHTGLPLLRLRYDGVMKGAEGPTAPRRTRRGRLLFRVGLGALGLALLLVAIIVGRNYYYAAEIFAQVPLSPLLRRPASATIAGFQDVRFVADDGVTLSAWYMPSKNGAAIVLLHGTSDDRTSLLPEIRFLAAAGFGVLAYDGPGYGLSGGTVRWGASAEGAARAGVRWLLQQPQPLGRPLRVGGLGLSLGAYTLVQAAADDARIGAVVVEASPPDIVANTLWEHRKWGALSQWPAMLALQRSPELLARPGAEARIAAISPRPVLLIGGDRDTTIPLFMTERLFRHAAAPKELWVAHGAMHGRYIEVFPQEYPARVVGFFRRALLVS